MKKKYVCISLILISVSLKGTLTSAENIKQNQFSAEIGRAQFKWFHFSSKPPKKHKGYNLVKVEKVSDGYIGYYL